MHLGQTHPKKFSTFAVQGAKNVPQESDMIIAKDKY